MDRSRRRGRAGLVLGCGREWGDFEACEDHIETIRLQGSQAGPQHLIFTVDVQTLYTCIPHADGLKALHKGGDHGYRMDPSYACLFVGYTEQSLFRSYIGPIPHLFLRYIDDCIGAASCSHEELEQFI
eukprot:g14460.t1